MRIDIEFTGSIETVVQSVDAEGEKTERARIRTLNKTAQWLKSKGVRRVSEEKRRKY
jgi:hypothetical protein